MGFSARVNLTLKTSAFELPAKIASVDRFFQVMQLLVKPVGNEAAIQVLLFLYLFLAHWMWHCITENVL